MPPALDDTWQALDPMASFATMVPGVSTDVAAGGMQSAGVVSVAGRGSPDNPMFWWGALLAVTLGLVGASTHLRVGPFKVSASGGKD
jgi:hypothetical protein